MHVFRLRHAGKVCSNDYDMPFSIFYLESRGKFLLGMLIFTWVSLGLLVIGGVVLFVLYKKNSR